jgi:hypothetical protein
VPITIFLANIYVFCQEITIFVPYINNAYSMETKDLNRIKVVLADKKRTNKWLAEQLGKDPATVSKWCAKRNLLLNQAGDSFSTLE